MDSPGVSGVRLVYDPHCPVALFTSHSEDSPLDTHDILMKCCPGQELGLGTSRTWRLSASGKSCRSRGRTGCLARERCLVAAAGSLGSPQPNRND